MEFIFKSKQLNKRFTTYRVANILKQSLNSFDHAILRSMGSTGNQTIYDPYIDY